MATQLVPLPRANEYQVSMLSLDDLIIRARNIDLIRQSRFCLLDWLSNWITGRGVGRCLRVRSERERER